MNIRVNAINLFLRLFCFIFVIFEPFSYNGFVTLFNYVYIKFGLFLSRNVFVKE